MYLLKTVPLLFFLLCSCTTLNDEIQTRPTIKKKEPESIKPLSYPEFLKQLSPKDFEKHIQYLEKKYDWFKIAPEYLPALDNYS